MMSKTRGSSQRRRQRHTAQTTRRLVSLHFALQVQVHHPPVEQRIHQFPSRCAQAVELSLFSARFLHGRPHQMLVLPSWLNEDERRLNVARRLCRRLETSSGRDGLVLKTKGVA